jgi:uncharacterized protein YdeI (YjbR/CyaY-like superfamily)
MNPVPQDFAAALRKAGLATFFDDYAPSHQREHLKWITEAKRPDTRKTRIVKTIQMLSRKRAEAAARAKKKT